MWKANVSIDLSFYTSTPQQMKHDIKVYNIDRDIGQSLWFVWWEILWSREQQQQNS